MKTFSVNKRARFDYEILETLEAGIELKGFEVKSIASGRVSTAGSYAIIRGNEGWIVNLDIPPYQPQNTPEGYDPKRTRKLLLHKKEIEYLIGRTKEKGLTIVPIKMYNKNSKIKFELGIGRSKKKHDKREVIKKRETEREMRRSL